MKSGGCELKRNQLENSTMSQRAKTRQGSGVSLKKQILEWWAALPEPTTRQVADLVGCGTGYVRVVVRQRKGTGTSDYDREYLKRKAEQLGMPVGTARYMNMDPYERRRHNQMSWASQKKRLAADPKYHAKRKAYQAQWHKDNRSKERL
jgi:hypothetical protein